MLLHAAGICLNSHLDSVCFIVQLNVPLASMSYLSETNGEQKSAQINLPFGKAILNGAEPRVLQLFL
jgi:hypothetical protein